jgi:hypothetical protein
MDSKSGRRLVPRTHLNAATSKYVQTPPEAKSVIHQRKADFEDLNHFVTKRGGWLTSICGDKIVDFQCLPESQLPDQIAALGFRVEPDGYTERILPTAINEQFVRGSDGSLEALTEGSTKPVVSTVSHAGICRVARYWFMLD